MLKQFVLLANIQIKNQPPSGGCVLKHLSRSVWRYRFYQPPSGGCVLKQLNRNLRGHFIAQPPSGGCVLKPQIPLVLF